jgi:SIR2-like protein
MLFLGAGASKAVELGDLQDLTKKIEKEFEHTEIGDFIRYIRNRIEIANGSYEFFSPDEIDLEVIFSILNAAPNHESTLKELGPYAVYLDSFCDQDKRLSKLFSKAILNKARKRVGTLISKSLEKYNKQKANDYYNILFERIKELPRYRTRTGTTNQPLPFQHIVTTNYDRVIENWFEENAHGRPPRIGFKTEARTGQQFLDLDGILNEQYQLSGNSYIEYLKLHGSIDWWIRDNDGQVIQRESSTSLRQESYHSKLMIYPIYDKHVSENPFFALYFYFRYLLYHNDAYISIGYSFRDPSINNAFRDALLNKTSTRLIIINREPKNVKKRIQNFPKDSVTFIKSQFGDENLPDLLIKALRE